MWRSSRASDRPPTAPELADRCAGFSLIEVLAAIIIAGAMVVVLSRGLTSAWSGTQAPPEVVAAATIARGLAAAIRAVPGAAVAGGSGRIGPYAYEIRTEPLGLEPRPARVPPAPAEGGAATGAPPPPAAARTERPPMPLRIDITVIAPSGRRLHLETVKLVPLGR